jgi:pyruvate formate lyase activating enzyme
MKNMGEEKSTSKGGWIFEIQKLSTEDGPGIRTTVFFKECPLRCIWCHNPESIWKKPSIQWFKIKCIGCRSCIEVCPNEALTLSETGLQINRELCATCGTCVEECPSTALKMIGKWWDVEELYREVAKDKVYFEKSGGGVTVSGGEPTLQMDFLLSFLKKCKENDIATALDTCGLSSKANYKKLIPFVDIFLFDIKEIDPKKHKEFVGHSNEQILANIIWIAEELKKQGKELWIRTPMIPRYTATPENVQGIAEFIVNKLHNNITRWDLLAFNNLSTAKYERMDMDWDLKSDPLLTEQEMQVFEDIAKTMGVESAKWSGLTRKE